MGLCETCDQDVDVDVEVEVVEWHDADAPESKWKRGD